MSDDSYIGQAGLTAAGSSHNVERVHRSRDLDERRTMVPVKIVAVYGGGEGAAPTVDVLPLIDSVDGLGNRTAHGVIYGIPTARSQSANGAVINDPIKDDTGLLHVADRDISDFKTTGKQSAPHSNRRGGLADGIFHGAVMIPGTPKQYVMFKSDGVKIFDANGHTIETSPGKITVAPKDGGMVYLGGDGSKGSYDFVLTPSGPSSNVKAKIG